jgi:hypothetical protein
MAKTYRVGVASMVHDHVWGELNHWTKLPNVELVAAGDVNADLRERIQSKFNVPKVYDSWQEMIASEELDIVQAASKTASPPISWKRALPKHSRHQRKADERHLGAGESHGARHGSRRHAIDD